MSPDLVVLYEHPDWQRPLFEVLDDREVSYEALDLKSAVFSSEEPPRAPVVFNQASPSAYTRGNQRAVPFTLALLRHLDRLDTRVVNGAEAFALELSKATQLSLMRDLGIDHPDSLVFNDPSAILDRADELDWPALLKPEQGGSGARMRRVEAPEDLEALLEREPGLWEPDGLLLVQELLDYDEDEGIVRLEFLDGELLYAMRVVSRGSFNLCPSEVCNPSEDREGSAPAFHAYLEVPDAAVETGKRIVDSAGIDVGAVEYIETRDGRRVFYDVNANSNLRAPVAAEFGFDAFERVADFLEREIERVASGPDTVSPRSPVNP